MPGERSGLAALAALFVLVALAAACAAPPPDRVLHAPTASPCPQHIASAEAWINRMPGPEGTRRQLIVSARTLDPKATVFLFRSDATTPRELVLDIRAASVVPVPGVMGYREPAAEPGYDRILLRCQGRVDFAISEIGAAF